jgi:hypothetical protein
VVFELDAPAGYRLEEPQARPEPRLRITLEAESPPLAVASRDPLVRSVRVKPAERRAEVIVGLATAQVHVTEMILAGPPRIVLDLRRLAPQTEAAPAASVSKPSAEPAPRKEPETAGRAAERGEREASTQKPQQPERGAEAQAPVPSRPRGPGTGVKAASGAEPSTPPAGVPPPVAERKPRRVPLPGAGGRPGVADPLRRNAGLILIAAGILILALIWLRLRRRARAGQMEAAAFEVGEAEAELSEATPAGPEEVAVPAESAAREEPRPFAGAEAPVQVQSERAVGEAAKPRTPDERLTQLEARLDDLLDSRERIERQMAAHTEELRVQRAAIARTQRVVRALTRGETEGGEPLQRPADRPPE